MYCPKCAAPMRPDYDPGMQAATLRCEAGDMPLSAALLDQLQADLAVSVNRGPAIGSAEGSVSTYFCVRCATPLRRSDPHKLAAECPACGFGLSAAAAYTLLEHHPHRAVGSAGP